MKLIRNLDTTLKIHACLAIVLFLGVGLAAWLLAQLGQLSELTAQVLQKGGAAVGGAQAAELLRSGYGETRNWSIAFIIAGLAVAGTLAAWLAAEVARPVHAAVVAAQRIAGGDLGSRIEQEGGGETGLLMRAMQEMNDKLVTMIVEVRTGSETISSGAGEIASSSMDLSARTEQQAASLEETASSMEELTSTVKQNADHAHQASKLAVSASEMAVKGGEVVSEVVGTMASIKLIVAPHRRDHRRHRWHCVPDQYSRPRRGGRSRAPANKGAVSRSSRRKCATWRSARRLLRVKSRN